MINRRRRRARQCQSTTAEIQVMEPRTLLSAIVNELIIIESDGSTKVGEDGTTDVVSIALASPPTSSVFVDVAPAADSDVTVNPGTIESTAGNWNQPQLITITGADNDKWDGHQVSTLAIAVDPSRSDSLFAFSASASVQVTILDDDPPAPVVTIPNDERLSPSVNLTWTGIPDADEYDLWLTRSGEDAEPFRMTVTETSHQMDSLGLGFYKFWVRGRQASGDRSPWGFGQFTVDKAVAISPITVDSEHRSPEIAWTAVPGATAYQVWANNSTIGHKGLVNTVATEPVFQFDNLGFGNHEIWVRAIGPNGFSGQWSPVVEHYVGPQNSPAPQATMNSRPHFSWNTMDTVEQFRIWISGPQGFRIDESGIIGTTYTPDMDLDPGQYRWWVMPQTAKGRSGRWSSADTIDVGGGAYGVEFAGEATDSSPMLRWQATEGAESYEVYLRILGGGSISGGNAVFSDITQTEFPMPVLPDGDFHVWIRPFNSQGEAGTWSQRSDLTLQTATVDIEVESDNRLQVLTIDPMFEFTWKESDGAASYDIAYVHPVLELSFEVKGVTGTSHRVENQPDGKWSWIIRARTDSGAVGPWSAGGVINVTGQPFFHMGDESTTSLAQPLIHWSPVTGADRYSLVIINLDTGETFFRDDDLVENRYGIESPMQPGKYRLWVQAISNGDPDRGTQSSPLTLTVEYQSQ